jgi:AraC family transcriptional regulator, exoenzyme S synthesis regulatory protein ExsA
MMVNLQDRIIESGLYKTIKVDELLFVQYQCFAEEDHSPVWTHNNYLAYVIGGKKMWRTHQKDYTVTSGNALFIKKGAHTVYQYFEENFYVIFIFLPDYFIYNTLKKFPGVGESQNSRRIKSDSVIRLDLNPIIESFFHSMISYLMEPVPPPADLLRLKMEELILSLFTQQGNNSLKQYFLSLGQRRKTDLQDVMEKYYTDPLSISDYARLSARSLSAFRRDFKEIYKTTPGKWLLEKRLAYSRFLLETSDNTVSCIADDCGFRNRTHFIKAFRENFGYPPNQFRIRKLMERT